jgi:hypothetical protein
MCTVLHRYSPSPSHSMQTAVDVTNVLFSSMAAHPCPNRDVPAPLSGLLLPQLLTPPSPPPAPPPLSASTLCKGRTGTALLGRPSALLGLLPLLLLLAVLLRLLAMLALRLASLALLLVTSAPPAPAAESGVLSCERCSGCTRRCTTSPGTNSNLSASPADSCTDRCAASSTAAVVAALPIFHSCSILTAGALNCCRSCCCCWWCCLNCPALLCSCPCPCPSSCPPQLLRKKAPGGWCGSAPPPSRRLPLQGPVAAWCAAGLRPLLLQPPAVLGGVPHCCCCCHVPPGTEGPSRSLGW